MNQCACDPSFSGIGYNVSKDEPNCPSYERACEFYSMGVAVIYIGIMIFTGICIYISFAIDPFSRHFKGAQRTMSLAKKRFAYIFPTRRIVLYLAAAAAFALRYIIILSKMSALENQSLLTFLDISYTLAPSIGWTSYTLLVYEWVYFYHNLTSLSTITNKSRFFTIYFVLNSIAVLVLIAAFSLEVIFPSNWRHSISGLWFAICIIIQTIFFFIYGQRIVSTIKEMLLNSESDVKQFKKLNRFTTAATVTFLVAVLFLIATSVKYYDLGLTYFLIRHSIYRLLEFLLLLFVVLSLQPSTSRYLAFLCCKQDDIIDLGSLDIEVPRKGSSGGLISRSDSLTSISLSTLRT